MRPDEEFKQFRRGFESGRPAQAHIVVGPPRGSGTLFAEKALGLVFCSSAEKPCGACRGCRQVADHTHPDVLWVEPQKRSRVISIDHVRDLRRWIFQTSFSGGWKAAVLTAADRLSPEASNALLKALEEPPGETVFFLLTDSPQFLLPTIVSRCRQITISGFQDKLPDLWEKRLLDILAVDVPDDVIGAFARATRAGNLLKEIKETVKKEETEIAAAGPLDEEDETIDARVNSRYREMRTRLVRSMLLWYRDILLLVCEADDDFVYYRRCLGFLKKKAGAMTYRQALGNVRIVEAMNRRMERNLNDGYVVGYAFSRLV